MLTVVCIRLSSVKRLVLDEAVQNWLSFYPEGSRRDRLYKLDQFMGFLEGVERFKGLSPSQLVEFQRGAAKSGEEFLVLDVLEKYINGKSGTYKSLLNYYSVLRSFFKKNRAPLPEDDFRINPDREPVAAKLSLEVVKTLVSNVSGGGRAFYLTLWMGLLDLERFRILNETGAAALVKHLKECGVEKPLMIEYSGRKQSRGRVKFYTFIGRDALAAWLDYFEHGRGWPRDGEPLIKDRYGNPIRKYSLQLRHLRLLERLKYTKRGGPIETRHGYNLHEFRDIARTLLHLQGKKDGLDLECAEFWMGHVTDPNQYDKFYMDENYTLEQYRIAEKYLNIVSESAAASQLQEEMVKRDQAIKKLTDKFEEATRRLENLEKKLREKEDKS